jgi:hypothetical protein
MFSCTSSGTRTPGWRPLTLRCAKRDNFDYYSNNIGVISYKGLDLQLWGPRKSKNTEAPNNKRQIYLTFRSSFVCLFIYSFLFLVIIKKTYTNVSWFSREPPN